MGENIKRASEWKIKRVCVRYISSYLLQFIYSFVVVVVLVRSSCSCYYRPRWWFRINIFFLAYVRTGAFLQSSVCRALSITLLLSSLPLVRRRLFLLLIQRITRSLCQLRVDSISDKINCIHNQIYHIFSLSSSEKRKTEYSQRATPLCKMLHNTYNTTMQNNEMCQQQLSRANERKQKEMEKWMACAQTRDNKPK